MASGLFVPVGLVATEDDLWVSDWGSGCVWQIVKDGAVLTPPILVASGLSKPKGLAIDLDGSLLVIEVGARCLSRIDLQTGEVSVLVEGLDLRPSVLPAGTFSGVAVGPSGYIYITGDAANVLYRFKPNYDGDE